MHFHGWIDLGRTGHIVCPGDWIINELEKQNFFPIKDVLFQQMYSEVSSAEQEFLNPKLGEPHDQANSNGVDKKDEAPSAH